jgi:hypothetical protein
LALGEQFRIHDRACFRFFAGLKPILKTAGHSEQQEILISRIECRLM